MKVLILTLTTGQGHNSTATALSNKLKQRGIVCRIVDACYQVSRLLGFTVANGYLLSVDRFSGEYAKLYGKLENRHAASFSPTIQVCSLIARKIGECIEDFAPDIIVCTHVFAALMLAELKRRNQLSAKTFGIVTDFTVHPYWEDAVSLDYIVIPSEHLSWQCRKKGFTNSQMLPFGIPINEKFEHRSDKAEAKELLGFCPDKPLITVMSGSMGYGSVSETVRKIDKLKKNFQIAAVCGSNVKEFEKLSAVTTQHKTIVYGYTDKIDLMMDASECIITKPGGISVSEALAKSLPMILNRPIPGHEERNMTFLLNCGVAKAVSDNCPVDEVLCQLLSDDKLRSDMTEAAGILGKPDSSERLASFIASL